MIMSDILTASVQTATDAQQPLESNNNVTFCEALWILYFACTGIRQPIQWSMIDRAFVFTSCFIVNVQATSELRSRACGWVVHLCWCTLLHQQRLQTTWSNFQPWYGSASQPTNQNLYHHKQMLCRKESAFLVLKIIMTVYNFHYSAMCCR